MFTLEIYSDKEIQNTINARDLHRELEVKSDFSTWFKYQIERLELDINKDYIKLTPEDSGAVNKIEYFVILECAEHISMASITQKGKEARQWFIETKKKYYQIKEQITDVTNEMLALQAMKNNYSEEFVKELLYKDKQIDQKLKKPISDFAFDPRWSAKQISQSLGHKTTNQIHKDWEKDGYIYMNNGQWEVSKKGKLWYFEMLYQNSGDHKKVPTILEGLFQAMMEGKLGDVMISLN